MNPFTDWSPEKVAAHNARVAKTPDPVVAAPPSVYSAPCTQKFTIQGDPVPAPRMSRRDKWLKPRRPCVQRYFDFRDFLQRAIGDLPTVPDELHCLFFVAMPESWSLKKKAEMIGKPHRTRPDRDNFDKAICDALFLEDGGVWKGSQEKLWAVHGRVEITMVWR